MLLTITLEGPHAPDLGYLLYKNPARPQTFELSYGKAHVFYTETDEMRSTAALLLDIDPIDLARGKRGSGYGGLFDYVNDRPYVSSSFLSTAISRVFNTAMTGKCSGRPELAQTPLPFTARLTARPCRGGEALLHDLFGPLGYMVEAQGCLLDEKFPEWGQGSYFNVTLHGTVRLCDLLHHLYVLIPVTDADKHYWVGDDEVEKLLRHGEGWLSAHPKLELITSRYFKRKKRLINQALAQLQQEEPEAEEETPDEAEKTPPAERLSLNAQRLGSVVSALKGAQARRVLDMGCGEGQLLSLLMKDRFFEAVAGFDVSFTALERTKERLKPDQMPEAQRARITLFQSSLTYRDSRFAGYDAVAVVEVIEHLDAGRLAAFEQVVFRHARPQTVIVTTPNREYNVHYEHMQPNALRHSDHRFEWTRAEFEAWARRVADAYGYTVRFAGIGEPDEATGSATQMGVFSR